MVTLIKVKKNLSGSDKAIIEHAVNVYGFVANGKLTPNQFADRISEVYSTDNSVNAEVVRVLRAAEA